MPSPYPEDTLRRLQEVETDLLVAIDKLCRDYDIDYFIIGGTLLGAVRHGGFIPWDDDVDIAIPYKDYLRFQEIAPRALPGQYRMVTFQNEKGFAPLWTKIFINGTRFIDEQAQQAQCEQGIFLDIFPYCQLESDPALAKKQYAKALRLQRMSYLRHLSKMKLPGRRHKKLITVGTTILHHTIARTWTTARMARWFKEVCEPCNPGDVWFTPCWAKMTSEGNCLFPTQDIEFQGRTVRAPRDSDAFLTDCFGDYMSLPPEEERYTHAPLVLDFGDGVNVMEGR